ncbi:enoyl-CoA hydratase/isomerase family protein [Microcella sp.]|uniref:enoyl-CoA hydratase/isomerase family protein n=1 Tax=Microcella sp. TaxID=1913979 RepID=UPI003F71153D
MASHVVVERSGGVARVVLDRAEKRNALTAEMLDGLLVALTEAERNGDRALVLLGAPGYFSAGADVRGYAESIDDPPALRAFTERANELCRRMTRSPVVIVAGVDGLAFGGGFELVLASDLVIASERSTFALPELSLGLIPGWGGTYRLTAYLGLAKTKEAIMTGRVLPAAELAASGLITMVIASDSVEREAIVLAERLAMQPAHALAAAKHAIQASAGLDGPVNLQDVEKDLLLDLFATTDAREGIAAFVEKRPPRFAVATGTE